jgi:threonyl-tRNA synthetase
VEVDDRSEKIGFKIRAAQTKKIPYMLVVGDRESKSGEVSVRNRFEGDQGAQSLESFLELIGELVKTRSTRP